MQIKTSDLAQLTSENIDVIVVGAGMVGLTAALALHNNGFNTLLVDGRDASFLDLPKTLANIADDSAKIESYDNRVSALTKASENILRNLDVWQDILQMRVAPYQGMVVWDGEGTGKVEFSSAQLYQDNLGHIVENSVVLAALLKKAQAQGLKIVPSCKVTALAAIDSKSASDSAAQTAAQGGRQITCEYTDNGQTQKLLLQAKLIVGADGAMSKIRQLSSIPLWQWDYGHNAIVTSVKTSKAHQKTAWQRFTADGPLAFLPLADDKLSSIVWSTSVLHAKELMALDDASFKIALQNEFEQQLGEILQVNSRAMFPLRQRHAKNYVQQSLALIGDASHTIHPLAGQGVNLGLLDAASLVAVLTKAQARRQFIGSEALLKQFQRNRQVDNLAMSASMQAFKCLFEPQNAAVTIARNLGMNLFNQATPLKQHVVKQAMGLTTDLPPLARGSH